MAFVREVEVDQSGPREPRRPEQMSAEEIKKYQEKRERVLEAFRMKRGSQKRPEQPPSDTDRAPKWDKHHVCWVRQWTPEDSEETKWEAWDYRNSRWVDGPRYVEAILRYSERQRQRTLGPAKSRVNSKSSLISRLSNMFVGEPEGNS